jgi:hypothetical protein
MHRLNNTSPTSVSPDKLIVIFSEIEFVLKNGLTLFRAQKQKPACLPFFYRKTCPPNKIPLEQIRIPRILPKILVLLVLPPKCIGLRVQPCKSTQSEHHCQTKTDACPSARSPSDIQGHIDTQFYQTKRARKNQLQHDLPNILCVRLAPKIGHLGGCG